MEIKEIDGKKYIEYNQSKWVKIRTVMNGIFLILLALAIVGLIMGLITIIKNKEMLQSEPLSYVMSRYNMEACSCIDSSGEIWESGDKGFQPHFTKTPSWMELEGLK